ncbi:MAG TPA: N-acetylmuramoyl-L-alanine amidase [Thermoanaerobaculia bacterium]|nr:N-acetylmuramoyl-L-alanine amidase [Thermoanaerobaculia bacterium]
MKDRRFWASLAFGCLLLPVLVAAQGDRQQPPPSPAPPVNPVGARPSVTLAGQGEIPVPVTMGANGPLFGLEPLTEALGGTLTSDESGESLTLRIGETDVVIGIGSPIVTIGESIVSLPQPTAPGEGGVQVPLELLQKTYGDLEGYSFDWRPEAARLTISKRGAREIPVSVDVVHLQGVTTVVLQFPEAPSYRVNRQPGQVEVQMLGDRLTPPSVPPVIRDPLVQSVTVGPQQVLVRLLPGAEAESYILENPFRLVFDVHRPSTIATPTTPQRAPVEQSRGVRTIVIDPGHGGTETGAIGPSGMPEKELTLILARDLEARLESSLPVRVVLTRNEDANVPHDTRAAIANQNQADLFISIHLNSSLGSGAHGAETYFLSLGAGKPEHEGQDSEDAAAGDDVASSDLDLILWDLAQSQHLEESQKFANLVQRELNEALQLKDRGVKQAPFRVLKGAAMPAVLVELGFINNPEEEKKLQDGGYRADLIDALARAVTRYKAAVEGREVPQALQGPQGQPGQPGPPKPGAQAPPANPGRGAGSPP